MKCHVLPPGKLSSISSPSSHGWQCWVGSALLPGRAQLVQGGAAQHPAISPVLIPNAKGVHRMLSPLVFTTRAPVTPLMSWGREDRKAKQGAWLFICVSRERCM